MSFQTDLAKTYVFARGGEKLRRRVLPLKVTLGVTYVCNHRCKLCGVWKIYRDDSSKRKLELELEDYQRMFLELRESLLYLDITGGEPFVRKDLPEVLMSAFSACPRLSTVTTTTNGMSPDKVLSAVDRLTGQCTKTNFSIGVSLDGKEPYHDDMRGLKGAFKNAVKTITSLKELMEQRKNLDVKVSYTIGSKSAGAFESFYCDVVLPMGLGISNVTFNVEHAGASLPDSRCRDGQNERRNVG